MRHNSGTKGVFLLSEEMKLSATFMVVSLVTGSQGRLAYVMYLRRHSGGDLRNDCMTERSII